MTSETTTPPGLLTAILGSYRDLRGGMVRFLDRRPRDAQLLVLAMLAAFVGVVAGLPAAIEQAQVVDAGEGSALCAVMSVRLFAGIFMTPLLLFFVAALGRLVAGLAKGKGSFWSARAASIWAVMVALPLLCLNGLLSGLKIYAPGPLTMSLNTGGDIVTALAFIWIWATHIAEVEGFSRVSAVFVCILCIFGCIAGLTTVVS